MSKRNGVQFLILVWILVSVFILRRDLETWCPMGGVESIYGYLTEGVMPCSLGATNFYMLTAVIVLTIFFKRAFCGYICPLGAIGELMRKIAHKIGIRQYRVPVTFHKILSLLKYPILAVIIVWTWRAAELIVRCVDPCYAVLTLGDEALWTTYAVLGLLVVLSLFIALPFCKWACPFAAVLNPFSRLGFARIVRDADSCSDCGACAKACPMAIPVDTVKQVHSSDCIACMECVEHCPHKKTNPLRWAWFGKRSVPRPHFAVIIGVALSLAAVFAAGRLIPMPAFVYERETAYSDSADALHLEIDGIDCSGSARQLVHFLERQDFNHIPGYLKVTLSPAHRGYVDVKIEYDAELNSVDHIQTAIVEPLFDHEEGRWRFSPFSIKDYDLIGTLE